MDLSKALISRYRLQSPLCWEEIKPLKGSEVVPSGIWNTCSPRVPLLSKVAVLKLNGGLGTTLGCTIPKSFMEAKNGKSFFDIVVGQLKHLKDTYHISVPLILMDSIFTHEDTLEKIKEYPKEDILCFLQSWVPRLDEDLLPLKQKYKEEEKQYWYPPGHGDVYLSLCKSGMLDLLRDRGIEYLFISNFDNLGATLDLSLLSFIFSRKRDLYLELSPKTKLDIKGGTPVHFRGGLKMLEVAEVPAEHKEEFFDLTTFKFFNTNNLWIRVDAIDPLISLDVIYNSKEIEGQKIVQLETAMGSALKRYKKSLCLSVPRSRFRPVKGLSDLKYLQSERFTLTSTFEIEELDLP